MKLPLLVRRDVMVTHCFREPTPVYMIVQANGENICGGVHVSGIEDAECIVRAVNALPGCIEAMELVLDFLEFVHDDLKHRGEAGGHRSKLRAALAAAKPASPGGSANH